MTSRHRSRFRIALLALCALLLAQWTLATHACPVIARAGDALAQAQVEAELAAQSSQDCHGSAVLPGTGTAPADSPTCVKHCVDEGSASNSAGMAFATPAASPLLARAVLPAATGPLQWQQAPARGDATAPPLSILYCVFLT